MAELSLPTQQQQQQLITQLTSCYWKHTDTAESVETLSKLLEDDTLYLATKTSNHCGSFVGTPTLLIAIALLPFDAINSLAPFEATLLEKVRRLPGSVHRTAYGGRCAAEWMLAVDVRPCDSQDFFFRLLEALLWHLDADVTLKPGAMYNLYCKWFRWPSWLENNGAKLRAFLDLLERYQMLTPNRVVDLYFTIGQQPHPHWANMLRALLASDSGRPRLEWLDNKTPWSCNLLQGYELNNSPANVCALRDAWSRMEKSVFAALDHALGVSDVARIANSFLFAETRQGGFIHH
jgi:hypothetical protein